MTDCKKTAPDALRTDRLLAVQNAMLTKINALEIEENAMSEPPQRDETLRRICALCRWRADAQ